MRHGNGVCADVLCDATGLTGSDVSLANDVQERRLTVVHVAHDGDDGRSKFELVRLVLVFSFNLFNRGVNLALALGALLNLELEAVLGAELDGDGLVHRLVDVGEDAHLHQIGNELEGFALHLIREIADDDGRLHRDDLRVGGQRGAWISRFGYGRGGCGYARQLAWTGTTCGAAIGQTYAGLCTGGASAVVTTFLAPGFTAWAEFGDINATEQCAGLRLGRLRWWRRRRGSLGYNRG